MRQWKVSKAYLTSKKIEGMDQSIDWQTQRSRLKSRKDKFVNEELVKLG